MQDPSRLLTEEINREIIPLQAVANAAIFPTVPLGYTWFVDRITFGLDVAAAPGLRVGLAPSNGQVMNSWDVMEAFVPAAADTAHVIKPTVPIPFQQGDKIAATLVVPGAATQFTVTIWYRRLELPMLDQTKVKDNVPKDALVDWRHGYSIGQDDVDTRGEEISEVSIPGRGNELHPGHMLGD